MDHSVCKIKINRSQKSGFLRYRNSVWHFGGVLFRFASEVEVLS